MIYFSFIISWLYEVYIFYKKIFCNYLNVTKTNVNSPSNVLLKPRTNFQYNPFVNVNLKFIRVLLSLYLSFSVSVALFSDIGNRLSLVQNWYCSSVGPLLDSWTPKSDKLSMRVRCNVFAEGYCHVYIQLSVN